MSHLKGKVALVTGSTSGIGLGIAHALADHGADIMLNGLSDDATVNAIKKEIEAKGRKVGFSGEDLSKAANAVGTVEQTIQELGSCDILVNNAGIQHTDNVEDFPPEKWDLILALMLTAPFHMVRTALPGMKKKGWGRIINISSAHGKVASAKKSAYVSAKHGLVGFSKVVALENAGNGVTSNCICPGWVLTPLVQKQIDALAQQKSLSADAAKQELLGEKQPSKEFVTPEQIGALALFLTSPAADQITGTEISIDGGWTAQ
jgi:3-hydroxybutyrate dehydrogenase